MQALKTENLLPDNAGVARVVEIWRGGGLVAFPTETVYGLGADARNSTAVAKIYAAKSRPSFNPLIVHVADLEMAQSIAVFDDEALKLAEAFWPGPLSLVLPVRENTGLSDLVTAGLDTVAIRIPKNSLAQELLRAFGGPVAAPSANRSGKISPTSAAHVVEELDGLIDAIVDGGECSVGLESTILKPGEPTALLRHGGVPKEAIEAVLGSALFDNENPDSPISPGQLASHYAPSVAVDLNVTAPQTNALWLGFGAQAEAADCNLSPSGNLTEAATNLFAYLRELDQLASQKGKAKIIVSPIPNTGLGAAINDRLTRSAAPRP